jgi:hypothetical protein
MDLRETSGCVVWTVLAFASAVRRLRGERTSIAYVNDVWFVMSSLAVHSGAVEKEAELN